MPIIKKNNYAFIDSQNLNLAINDLGWKLNFQRFRRYIQDKYDVQKAFIFIGYIEENEKLYSNLTKWGYTLIHKKTLELPSGLVKGNVDAELVLHTMIEWPNYEKAVIVSGDGDFRCLIEYLVKKDKLEKLIIPNRRKYSSLLKEYIKSIQFMNSLQKKLELRKRVPKKETPEKKNERY